jgi:hypothetical protein
MTTTAIRILKLSVVPILIFCLALACSDVSVSVDKALQNSVENIAILPLENKTSETAIEQLLNDKVTDAFIANGRLNVTDKSNADVLLQWTLQRYDKIVLAQDSNQVPIRYRLQIIVDADLIDANSGKLLLTTRRSVDLTPEPTATSTTADTMDTTDTAEENVADWDSTELRSLKEFTTYYLLNNLGKIPEDEYSAQQRIADQMARRLLRLVLGGSFAPNPSQHRGSHHLRQNPQTKPIPY